MTDSAEIQLIDARQIRDAFTAARRGSSAQAKALLGQLPDQSYKALAISPVGTRPLALRLKERSRRREGRRSGSG